MKILPISSNNYKQVYFGSRIPTGKSRPKDLFVDAWPRLVDECKLAGRSDELNMLLDNLKSNGDNNILALDFGPKDYKAKVFTFGLFKNKKNLAEHRTHRFMFCNPSSKTKNKEFISIAPTDSSDLTKMPEVKCIGNMAMDNHGVQYDKCDTVLDSLLNTLRNILTKGTQENQVIYG